MEHRLSISHGDTLTLEVTASASFTVNVIASVPTDEPRPDWTFPVLHPENWRCRGYSHNPGTHTGYDLNLNIPPFGNIDAGEPIFAVTAGVVTYVATTWGTGGGMVVIQHAKNLWLRYAHLTPAVEVGDYVEAGTLLGVLVPLPSGAHLHFDGATSPITTHWLSKDIYWLDPQELLLQHLPAATVKTMFLRT